MKLVSIGGYGFEEAGFLGALRHASVDTFVDVRQRRGMRGSRYAFLNSSRLQNALAAAGIRYVHLRELAPTEAVRKVQQCRDAASGIGKRLRTRLSPEFVSAYKTQVLNGFDVVRFRQAIGDGARIVAVFCVETEPEACHRSLIVERLASDIGAHVEHIRP